MTEDYCNPLEQGQVFLMKRGFINPDNAKALIAAVPGSTGIWVTDIDAIKIIVPHSESIDRIAGAISENP